ncbi:NAD(P)-dependent oxidoreductase [Cohnella cellulosilytica]|uniref:NAD(P)-dependent oxidoreductase n=1 Tax=Cohnella cellulosilytica TaxID=986710 RepID=A0ABW2FKS6_9BACL
MNSVIVVHPNFEATWPWVADHLHALWQAQGPVEFIRLSPGDERTLGEIVTKPDEVTRLVSLVVPVTAECLQSFAQLREAAIIAGPYQVRMPEELAQLLKEAGVKAYTQLSEGFWGQSVSEFGLALTLCGLRRIPQTYREMIGSLAPWDYDPEGGVGRPHSRGEQFGDDANFTNGTVAGKRIRIVGAGNIASRYASFVNMLGADVAAWDPYATEPSFHRAGTRREHYLEQLMKDAEIFVPMVPLTEKTEGLITAEHINALPKGCLVVLVTRAGICDMDAIRRRVLNDEISLAADVFDVEPLELDDPLLGRHNVVHTPHNAGRTIEANYSWAEKLAEQFLPVSN